ncbi:hypothetical protein [Paraburkholderia sp. MM5482-R1]|uniref:hypothetical protein n=1 Tax=unclassified Paraburkholderia TaxID=2615204 RepID=UPI003D24DBD2
MSPSRVSIAQALTATLLCGIVAQPSLTFADEPPDVAELYEASGICYILSTEGRATVIKKPMLGEKPVLFKADDEVFCESASFAVIRYLQTNATFRVNYPGWQPVGNPGPANGGPGPNDPARLGRRTSIDPQVPLKTANAVALAQAGGPARGNWWNQDLFAHASKPDALKFLPDSFTEPLRFAAYLPKSQWVEWAYTPNPTSDVVARYVGSDAERLEKVIQLNKLNAYDYQAGSKM